jgi:ABC-type amino acid transport substrate-binding protein
MRCFRFLLIGCLWSGLVCAPAFAQQAALRIGISNAYFPFSYLDEDSQAAGFEVDVTRALCAEMKVECVFIADEWALLIPGLLAHKYDAIAASVSITAQRRQQMLFTNRYYRTSAVFVMLKGAPVHDTSPAALKGMRLGAQAETIHSDYLEKFYGGQSHIKLFVTQRETELALVRGNVDAILADKIVLHHWLKTRQGTCCTLRGKDITDRDFLGDGVGIAMRKDSPALKKRLDIALERIMENGTYSRINNAYFPFNIH